MPLADHRVYVRISSYRLKPHVEGAESAEIHMRFGCCGHIVNSGQRPAGDVASRMQGYAALCGQLDQEPERLQKSPFDGFSGRLSNLCIIDKDACGQL